MEPFIKNLIAYTTSISTILAVLGYVARSLLNKFSEIRKETREYNLQIKQFEHELRFGWIYQKRMEIIEVIYNSIKLINHEIVVCRDNLFPVMGTVIEDISFEDIESKNNELKRLIDDKSLYLSTTILEELQEAVFIFENAVKSIGIEQILRKQNDHDNLSAGERNLYDVLFMNHILNGMEKEQIKDEIRESSHENIQKALYSSERAIKTLETEFRKIIGVDENQTP